jgi:putative DNA primase/helicase
MLEAALNYAGKGWAVFPVKKNGKTPACKNGLNDGTTNEAQIVKWWTETPDANIGIATGKVSGFFVIDLDERNGGFESFDELEREFCIPITFEVTTPSKGRHLYFEMPSNNVRSSTGWRPGLDIKANGGYVLAPPSYVIEHEKEYEGPYTFVDTGAEIEEAPDDLLDALQSQSNVVEFKPKQKDGNIPSGKRDDYIFGQCCRYRNIGLNSAETLSIVMDRHFPKLQQPGPRDKFDAFTKKDIIAKVNSAYKREQFKPKIILKNAADIEPESIDWLWKYWLARKKLHLLAGAPETGKTTASVAIAATITCGGRFPDGTSCKEGKVVMWSGEDDYEDTILPRFMACGGKRENLYFISGMNDGEKRAFDPATDMKILIELLEVESPDLLVIEPIVSVIQGGVKQGDNAGNRRGLQSLVDAADRCNCVVLGITHFTKFTSGQKTLERVTGSLAFGAVPRIVFATAKKLDSKENIFLRIKSNIGDSGGGFNYLIEKTYIQGDIETTNFLWGKSVEGSPDELMFESDSDFDEGSKLSEAKEFLLIELKDNPLKASEIMGKAKKNGISEITLKRAKTALKIKSKKDGLSGNWRWYLT